MANEEHVNILKQGVETWNRWREEHPEIEPDLSGADLRGADLFQADLRRAELTEANLSGANLSEANLYRAYLTEADLTGANLREANLRGAYLYRPDLSAADLTGANLRGAYLSRANLSGAYLTGADLTEADLTGANLSGAYLFQADLSAADLTGTNLRGANLTQANLTEANLSDADLSRTSLRRAILIQTNLERAKLADCAIYGISAWGPKLEESVQTNLIITPHGEPTITVDNLEVAQFIYLLLHNEKIRDIINTITTKVVLILGRFTPERKRILDAIRDELRNYNLLPVIFDFDKPATRDTHETVTTLARMARFIIADITDPRSIPQELVSVVQALPSVPVQPLLKLGSEPWGMYDHIRRYPWVLGIHRYRDLDDLLTYLEEKVIGPAEAKAKELQSEIKTTGSEVEA